MTDIKQLVERLRDVAQSEHGPMYTPSALSALLSESADALSRMQWISVEERLPEPDEIVCVWSPASGLDTDAIDSDGVTHEWYFMTNGKITHWMPLPEPPKEAR